MAVRNTAIKNLLLLGAGHVHLPLLVRYGRELQKYYNVTLLGPPTFAYSGSAPAAILNGEAAEIDVARLCARLGINFIADHAIEIQPGAKRILLNSGRSIEFDLLSLNLGGDIRHENIYGTHQAFFPVKPTSALRAVIPRLLVTQSPSPSLVVIGGGAAGVEVSAVIAAACRQRSSNFQITIVSASASILPGAPSGAQKWVKRFLQHRGIKLRCASPVVALHTDRVTLASGEELSADAVIGAWGISPSPLMKASGLTVTLEGYLLVDRYLRASGSADIFGGGDAVRVLGASYPAVGVHAVDAGYLIGKNLTALAKGDSLLPFRRKENYLQILNLGDGEALAVKGGWWWHGSLMSRWKQYLDRRFLAQFAK